MIIYPAIDILDGKTVRLVQGDFERRTVYEEDPVVAAERWAGEGARFLHVVDLDGAKAGRPVNLDHLRRICERVTAPVQYGGGLRSLEHMRAALDSGAERVVLGTAAFTDPGLLDRAHDEWGERVAVAIDVRGGLVSTAGWVEQTQTSGIEAVTKLRERGVESLIYTNVDRDGTLSGPDPVEVASVSERVGSGRFLYSGGIGSLDDLRSLVDLRLANLMGVVVGKALYEGRIALQDAQRLAEQEEVPESS